jgi:hypothetical protein
MNIAPYSKTLEQIALQPIGEKKGWESAHLINPQALP